MKTKREKDRFIFLMLTVCLCVATMQLALKGSQMADKKGIIVCNGTLLQSKPKSDRLFRDH